MKVFFLVVVPVVEIVAAAVVAHFIGWGWAILALMALSLIGVWQLKVQGLAAWRSAVGEIDAGAAPAPAVLDGVIRLVGAVLVALPGFVSALIGGVLLVRPIRRVASQNAGLWVVSKFRMPFVVVADDAAAGWRFRSASAPTYVDVDGWEEPVAGRSDDAGGSPPMLTRGSTRS